MAWTKHVYAHVSAAEKARRAEWLRTRWPVDAVVDADVLAVDDIAYQVDVQNDKLEEQVDQLSNLLTYGLLDTPSRSSDDAATSDERPDPKRIVVSVESALSAMRLPRGFETAARVAYSPDSRQVVVEFELPKDAVISKAKSYRWVKSREVVQGTPLPSAQVKSPYAGAIAQLTLLCLANIFAADHTFDVAVFNGVVDTLDRRNGQPIRPA